MTEGEGEDNRACVSSDVESNDRDGLRFAIVMKLNLNPLNPNADSGRGGSVSVGVGTVARLCFAVRGFGLGQ